MYISRIEEENLNKYLNSEKFEFIVLYGRRRVGKTTLIKHILPVNNSFYYLGLDIPYVGQLTRLKNKISEHFIDTFLSSIEIKDYINLFEYIIKIIGKKNKFVIVLDEFQYFFDQNKSVLSQFQYLIDELLLNTQIKLIIMGSSISLIENNILGYKSPLFGRKTASFDILPFNFQDFAKFFPKYNLKELIEVYSVLNGIPYYADFFDPNIGVLENIIQKIFSKGSIFLEETINILKYEITEFRTYFFILSSIANGANKFSEISSKTSMDKSNLTKYLFTLQKIGLIKRHSPILENSLKSKKGIYKIDDLFINFSFNYIWPNKDIIENNIDNLKTILIDSFDYYVSKSLDKIIFNYIINCIQLPFEIVKIGRQWDKNHEFDICGYDLKKNKILIGEIKWTNKKIENSVLNDLIGKTNKYLSTFDEIYYILVSKNGFSDKFKDINMKNLILIDCTQNFEKIIHFNCLN